MSDLDHPDNGKSQHLDDGLGEEFDAFLLGDSVLAKELQQLATGPSDTLTAAILLRAEQQLASERKAPVQTSFAQSGLTSDGNSDIPTVQAANDAVNPDSSQVIYSQYLRNWRAPLAIAAGLILALLMTLRWYSEFSNDQPALAKTDQITPAKQSGDAEMPQIAQGSSEPTIAYSEMRSPRISESKKSQNIRLSEVLAQADTGKALPETKEKTTTQLPSSIDTNLAQNQDGMLDLVKAQKAEAEERYARARTSSRNEMVISPAPVVSAARPNDVSSLPPAASPAAPPPPLQQSVDNTRPDAWLVLIDELLKADLNHDALDEWDKFHKAYPDYPVSEKLMEKIKVLKK